MKQAYLCLVLLLWGLVLPTFAQPALTAEQRYDEAIVVVEVNGEVERGQQMFIQVANDFPGSIWAAKALQQAARWTGDHAESKIYLQRIVDEYPDTDYAFIALTGIQFIDYNGNLEGWFAAASQLAVDLGGPPFETVLQATDRAPLSRQVRALPIDTQWRLYTLYFYAWSRTSDEFLGRDQPERGLPMAYFLRETFEDSGLTPAGAGYIFDNLTRIYGNVTGYGTKTKDPTVSIQSPIQNAATSPLPEIRIEIVAGDFQYRQTDLRKMEVSLDGQSLKSRLDIRSQGASSLQEGVPLETLSLSVTPETPLASGPHTIAVTAVVTNYEGSGPGRTQATLDFTVSDDSTPSNQTLNVSKDSILSQQNPHRNEGANNLLQLSHRPEEKNKSNNPIIAFDLANVNLTGLRKARLVLNIQECEQPKKWGPEGRNILAYPVNEAWVEGNGETIKTGQGEKTRGSGQGVTWFSPIDENIANKAPDGALQWSGARPFLGPLTAPPVLITNKQVGTIEFDVTQDVKSGFTDGWLVRKQDEAAFGNVRFYSKEGAAGNQALAPRLILEYNGTTAQAPSRSLLSIILQLVEQGYRQLQADRDAPGSGLSWLVRWRWWASLRPVAKA